jgi:hypothetical protein
MSELTPTERKAVFWKTCPDCGAEPRTPCQHLTAHKRSAQALKHPHRARVQIALGRGRPPAPFRLMTEEGGGS